MTYQLTESEQKEVIDLCLSDRSEAEISAHIQQFPKPKQQAVERFLAELILPHVGESSESST